jgi:hypothetical protein
MSSGLLIYKIVGEKILKGGPRDCGKMNHFFKKCFENQNTKCLSAGSWALAKSLIRKFVKNPPVFPQSRNQPLLSINKKKQNNPLLQFSPFYFMGGLGSELRMRIKGGVEEGWRIGEKMNRFFKKCFENQNPKCQSAGSWALVKSLIRKFVENSFIFSPFRFTPFLLIKKKQLLINTPTYSSIFNLHPFKHSACFLASTYQSFL